MSEHDPETSANTTQFQAFMAEGQTEPDRGLRAHSSTIIIAGALAVLVLVAVVAALAM